MWFRPTEENFTSLDDLAASIVSISADPAAMVIRGALKPAHRDALTGISTIEAANRWLSETFIAAHNKQFAIDAEQEGSAFVADAMGPGGRSCAFRRNGRWATSTR